MPEGGMGTGVTGAFVIGDGGFVVGVHHGSGSLETAVLERVAQPAKKSALETTKKRRLEARLSRGGSDSGNGPAGVSMICVQASV